MKANYHLPESLKAAGASLDVLEAFTNEAANKINIIIVVTATEHKRLTRYKKVNKLSELDRIILVLIAKIITPLLSPFKNFPKENLSLAFQVILLNK